MKKLLLITLFTSFLFGCKEETKIEYAIFSGTVTNSKAKTVKITGNDFKESIAIDAEGKFSDTLRIANDGYFSFKIGRESSALFLTKGANLNLTIDTEKFDESIAYTGAGADENNFLAKKYLLIEEMKGDQKDFYSLEAEAYKSKINNIKEAVSKMIVDSKLNESFKQGEEKNNNYTFLSDLSGYSNAHSYFAQVKDLQLPEGFLKELETLDYNNEADFASSDAYKQLVQDNFNSKLMKVSEKNGGDYTAAFLATAKEMPNGKIKQEILNQMSFGFLNPNEHLEDTYKVLMESTTDDGYKKAYTETYNKLQTLSKGKPSPTFNYENHKGGKTSLAELKGQYVYIDVWATWCGPCKAEIPSLKKIEEKYHGKNISFVSISVDAKTDHETWKNMVNEKELGGLQLFSENSWKSKFVTDYAIQGIPRFILVDPDGNIVSADAPRPSEEKLVSMFDELKI